MGKKTRLVQGEIEFEIKNGQCLVISYASNGGLERVVVEIKDGVAEVRANGRTRFEFSDEKEEPGMCDFWLANPSAKVFIEDVIRAKFWSQFTWGELFAFRDDKNLNRMLRRKIGKFVEKFEERVARELNKLFEDFKEGFPYLPPNRKPLYVKPENRFMREATKMMKGSGCVKQETGAVVVKKGQILGRGANAGKVGHAEVAAILDAIESGYLNLNGASLYLDGHWWCCEDCWDAILAAGISKVYLREDSIELYKRDEQ